jgi:hypothetical protein
METICQPFALANSVSRSTCEVIAALFSDDDSRAYIAQRAPFGAHGEPSFLFDPCGWNENPAGLSFDRRRFA